ncbi:glutathione S-transferase family protein [Caulobacter hibisci]|uniref:Glutathione S-transferase family protein n=1 Tax=Caulobacter hibisci TaxID=2035993 RepID=A0ABS0T1N7_9CAUL|nr:glutathione S-transferase family protein [Caulobacter hibisci]MBI1685781.1 glutathione S-transferase family protein [Caulobacter hibisci]
MALILHAHPLSSFCHKALVALYELDLPFEQRMVNFGDPDSAAAFRALWPVAKMPVLEDTARGQVVPESSILIEYLQLHHPAAVRLIPEDPAAALEVRARDRFFDLHVQVPMQKIVNDRIRPGDAKDPHGLAEAKAALSTALDLVERDMATRTWAAGEAFSLADCAAAPALFYTDKVMPFLPDRPNAAAYLERLKARPSYARALEEAAPYFAMFPG